MTSIAIFRKKIVEMLPTRLRFSVNLRSIYAREARAELAPMMHLFVDIMKHVVDISPRIYLTFVLII